MYWSERDGRRYLYCSIWQEGRCIKRYVGTGEAAEQAARQHAADRLQKLQEQLEWSEVWARMEVACQPLDTFCEAARLLHHAVLLLGGFHLHKGHEWRRRVSIHD